LIAREGDELLTLTTFRLAVWCSGNALVSINAVALHRARLVLGWVTAFGQVNCLITQPATQANSAFHPFRVDK